jgi:hypothetical protein
MLGSIVQSTPTIEPTVMDSPPTLRMSFNGNLLGEANDSPLSATPLGGISYEPSDLGHSLGLRLEEATTNYMLNPIAVGAGSWSVWNSAIGSFVTGREEWPHGTAYRAVCPGLIGAEGFSASTGTLNLATGTAWAGSIDLVGNVLVRAWLRVQHTDATSVEGGHVNVQLNEHPQRISVTYTPVAGKTISSILLFARTLNVEAGEIIGTKAQIENKAYPTGYADGTKGANYAWTGTAHASTSTRVNSYATITTPDAFFTTSGGTIAVRAKYGNDLTTHQAILGNNNSTSRLYLLKHQTDKKLYFGVGSNAFLVAGPVTNVDEWYNIIAEWNATEAWMTVNGITYGPVAYSGFTAVTNTLVLGYTSVSSNRGNIVASQLMTKDRPLTTEERANLIAHQYFAEESAYNPRVGSVVQQNHVLPMPIGTKPSVSLPLISNTQGRIYGDILSPTVTGSQRFGLDVGKEGTTNLVTNPSFETNTTRWGVNVSAVMTRVTDIFYSGIAALRVVSTAAVASGVYHDYMAATVGESIAISVYMRGAIGGETVKLFLSQWNGLTFLSNVESPILTLTNTWERYTFVAPVAAATTTQIRLYVGNAAATVQTWHIDNVQVEKKNYVTDYADGSLGANHTWTGTAHASTSVRATTTQTIDHGLFSEEATTNLITNPSAETNTTNILPLGSTTITRVQGNAFAGEYFTRSVLAGSVAGEGPRYRTAGSLGYTTARNFKGSVYVRGTGSVYVGAGFYYTDLTYTEVQGTVIALTGEWQRIESSLLTTTAGKTVDYGWVNVRTNTAQAITIECDAAQFEERAYPSSYADGDMGTGYAWTGTAHGSSSTRAATSVQYNNANTYVNTRKGEFWTDVMVPRLASVTSNSCLLRIGAYQSGSGYGDHIAIDQTTATNIRFAIRRQGFGTSTYNFNPTGLDGVPLRIGMWWTDTNLMVRVIRRDTGEVLADTITVRTLPAEGLLTPSSQVIQLGHIGSGGQNWNGYIKNATLFTNTLTESQRTILHSMMDANTVPKNHDIFGTAIGAILDVSSPEVNVTEVSVPRVSSGLTKTPQLALLPRGSYTPDGPVTLATINGISDHQGTFMVIPPTTNLSTNPRFGVDGSLWNIVGTAGTVQHITNDGVFGGTCMEHTRTTSTAGNQGRYQPNLPVSADTMYTCSFYIKPMLNDAQNVRVAIEWRTAADALVSTVISPIDNLPVGKWTRLAVSGLAPATAAFARPYVCTSSGIIGEKYRFTALQLEAGSTATPYCDGSQPGCAWTGTPHASTSTRAYKQNKLESWRPELAGTNLLGNPQCVSPKVANANFDFRYVYEPLLHPDGFYLRGYRSATVLVPTSNVTAYTVLNPTLTQGTEYAFQAYVRIRRPSGAYSGTAQLLLWETGGASVSETTGAVGIAADGEWHLMKSTGIIKKADRTGISFYVQQFGGVIGDIVDFTAMQVELGNVHTTFISGDLGPGYSWTGASEGSTSTRGESFVRTTEINGVITQQKGCYVVRAKMSLRTGNTCLIDIGGTGATIGLIQSRLTSQTNMNTVFYDAGVQQGQLNHTMPAIGEWFLLGIAWDGPNVYGWVNDGVVTTSTRSAYAFEFSDTTTVGANRSGSLNWQERIDGVIFLPELPSAAERTWLNSLSEWDWSNFVGSPAAVIQTG